MPARKPDEAPARYGQWIDELKRLHRGEMALAGYSAVDGAARRLMKTNPRLTPDKANWLASHWSVNHAQPDGSERWQILGEAAHKIVNAHIFRVDETLALYARITASVADGRGIRRQPERLVERTATRSTNSTSAWRSVANSPHRAPRRRRSHAAPRPAAARGADDRRIPRRTEPPQARRDSLSRLAICAAA